MLDIKPGVFWVSFSQFPQSELLSSGGGAPTKYFSTLFKSSSYLLFSLLLTLVLDFRPTWRIQKCSYWNLFTVYAVVTMVKFKQQIFKTKFSKCSSSWRILFKKHFFFFFSKNIFNLIISASVWVLRTPNAGWNMHF